MTKHKYDFFEMRFLLPDVHEMYEHHRFIISATMQRFDHEKPARVMICMGKDERIGDIYDKCKAEYEEKISCFIALSKEPAKNKMPEENTQQEKNDRKS